MGRLFCIADIHGRLDLLQKLWNDLLTNHSLDLTKDKVIFTGDYCDRGPNTYGVICFLKELCEKYPGHVICLAGNHEWINIMYYARGSEDDRWLHDENGGPATKLSYQMAGYSGMTQEHLQWLAHLPFKHEEPGFFFSHAPAPPDNIRSPFNKGQPLTDDELSWGVWNPLSGDLGMARDHGNGIVGVCGHIHALRRGIMAPRFYDYYIFADAGCGCSPNAPLCAVNVITRDVVYAWP